MPATTTVIDPTTRSEPVRTEAAARGRGAARRPASEQRRTSRSTRRLLTLTWLAMVLLALVLIGGDPASADVDDSPPIQGYTPGRADGWFAPGSADAAATTAGPSSSATSTVLRIGSLAGRPDGWFAPTAPDVQVAGVSLSRTDTATVPPNVR